MPPAPTAPEIPAPPPPGADGARLHFTAEERAALRAEAWLDLPRPLLAAPFDLSDRPPRHDLRLAPFSVERENFLHGFGSPLVTGQGFPDRLSLLLTLWLLSPGLRVGSRFSFLCFVLRWWFFVPFGRTVVALRRWRAAQFIDEPPRETRGRTTPPPGAYWFAGFVLTCKLRLALGELEALKLPIPRLLQQLAALASARGGETPHFDPERDKQAGAYLRAKLARQQAAANPPMYDGVLGATPGTP